MTEERKKINERRATRQQQVDQVLTGSQDELNKTHPEKCADDLQRRDPRLQSLRFRLETLSIDNFDEFVLHVGPNDSRKSSSA